MTSVLYVLISFVIFLLILTKLLDVLSTLRRIRYASNETNPFARKLMYRWGPKATVWFVFVLAVIIIGVAGYLAYLMGPIFQIAFILVGIFISLVQFAVAAANWSGKDNLITRQVRKVYGMIQQLFITAKR